VVVTDRPLAEIERAAAGTAFVVLTHSHALDFALCSAVLEHGDFAYLGLIGSLTKRRRFERGFRELGIPEERAARLVCPIGGDRVRDKRPAVIAALTAAELLVTLAAVAGNGMIDASMSPPGLSEGPTDRAVDGPVEPGHDIDRKGQAA
jgi:xanthine/CO dehydrogenase XdhC/CoxF family maturation factor